MKHILILLVSLITVITSCGAEPVTFVYQGEVAGVMCSACSSHVEAALKKLPGVQSVTITAAKEGGLPRLEVVSTSAKLTREDAIKALGDQAEDYQVRSLELVKAK